MANSEAFDNFAKECDEWFIMNDDTYVSELMAKRKFLPGNKPGLEIGAGTGRFGVLRRWFCRGEGGKIGAPARAERGLDALRMQRL